MTASNSVTLIDGTQVDSASEAFRHECECRYVLSRSPAEQREYSEIVLHKRGQAEVNRMRETMRKIREATEGSSRA